MKTTLTLAQNLNTNVFQIFDQDVDTVITLINFYIAYGDQTGATVPDAKNSYSKETRIRVNDDTATNGWF